MYKRGFLRSSEGTFSLAPKLTIIGREGCDFIIQNITVDNQHAVIEFLESDECFILKDLNSTHGTYVNDCRVQNASVRLAEGDILRFGFSVGQYEFHSDDVVADESDILSSVTYSTAPSSQKIAWQQPPISQQQQPASQVTTLPVIHYSQPQPLQQRYTVTGTSVAWPQCPRPTSNLKLSRPQSANNFNKRQLTPTAPPAIPSSTSSKKGSISGPSRITLRDQRIILPEDSQLYQLQQEIDRLKALDHESSMKSQHVEGLLQNVELLHSTNQSQNEELMKTIKDLTEEISQKEAEIIRLQGVLEQMGDSITRMNSNSSNNDVELSKARKEFDKTKKDLQVSYGLINTLQKDLSNRDDTLTTLKRDIEMLNNIITEKDINIASLTSKLSRLNDLEEDESEKRERERELSLLKKRLQVAESTVEELNGKINTISENLEQSKQNETVSLDKVKSLNQELETEKGMVSDMQQKESILRADCIESQNKFEAFRSKILKIVTSSADFKSSSHSLKDDEVIAILKSMAKSRDEFESRILEKHNLYEESVKSYQSLKNENETFKQSLKDNIDMLNYTDRTQNRIDELIKALRTLQNSESIESLKEVIIENFENEKRSQQSLEIYMRDAGPEFTNLSITEVLKKAVEKSVQAVEEKNRIESQLLAMNEDHKAEMETLKHAMILEANSKVKEAVEAERHENHQKLQTALDEAARLELEKTKLLINDHENKYRQFEQEIEDSKKKLTEKDAELMNYLKLLDQLEEYRKKSEELERDLDDMTEKKNVLEQSIHEKIETLNEKWKSEVNLHKEEASQHAITIESLNNRLIKLDKDNKDLQNQIIKFKSDKKKTKSAQTAAEVEGINPNCNVTIANLERCISALRHENVALKNKITEQENAIKSLSLDLAGAEAKLSDVKGELSEAQKTEIDTLKIQLRKSEDESSDLRVQLSKLSGFVDRLTQDLDNEKLTHTKVAQQLVENKKDLQEKESRVKDMERQMETDNQKWASHISSLEREGRISTDLATLGSQCRGERHLQIIESQKAALSELRQKMKTSEIAKSSNMAIPEVTHQMLSLRKELAELRAKQSLQESIPQGMRNISEMIGGHGKNKHQVLALTNEESKHETLEDTLRTTSQITELQNSIKQLQFDLNFEKSSSTDFQQSLAFSESSYLYLMKQITGILEITNPKGLRSFDNLSPEDKQILVNERVETCGLIMQKVKILRERLERKEELLLGYEKDLVKLRQAEDLASKTKCQFEDLIYQIRCKGEEVDLLRETLNRTKDLLNQEKRVNVAIKQHKTYVPEKDYHDSRQALESPKYHCPPEDLFDKEKHRVKQTTEKLKRKNYEIKSLKSELVKKEKELCHATNRLYNLETSMGIKSEEPV